MQSSVNDLIYKASVAIMDAGIGGILLVWVKLAGFVYFLLIMFNTDVTDVR